MQVKNICKTFVSWEPEDNAKMVNNTAICADIFYILGALHRHYQW